MMQLAVHYSSSTQATRPSQNLRGAKTKMISLYSALRRASLIKNRPMSCSRGVILPPAHRQRFSSTTVPTMVSPPACGSLNTARQAGLKTEVRSSLAYGNGLKSQLTQKRESLILKEGNRIARKKNKPPFHAKVARKNPSPQTSMFGTPSTSALSLCRSCKNNAIAPRVICQSGTSTMIASCGWELTSTRPSCC